MKFYTILIAFVMLCQQGLSQVKGRVSDAADNQPLAGVVVNVVGTNTFFVTTDDGTYSIVAKKGDQLSFSFVGYTEQIIPVFDATVINVILKSDNVLDEVVVVGYGVQKRSDVTGSVASMSAKRLEERPEVNVVQALQGAVAGLNITVGGSNAEGSTTNTTIRGSNSITASNKPLMVVDGIPFSGGWAEINSNDIQSVEILKDASSAAIYGARGSNGVILITTKKGSGEKLSVSYDGFVSIDDAINIPKMMNGATFAQRKKEAGGDFTLTEQQQMEKGASTDWLALGLRSGFKQQHNLSLSGSTQTSKYYLSMNLADNKGISVNDKFSKYGIRINMEQKLGSWLTVGTNTSLGYYDRSGNEADFSKSFLMNPLGVAYNDDGSLRMQTWEDNNYSRNPLSSLNDKNKDIARSVITNNYIDIQFPFVKGLSYRLNTGYTFSNRLYQNYQGLDTYEGMNANGVLAIENTNSQDWIVENLLNYKRDFGKHSLFVTALYSAQQEDIESQTTNAQDFPNDVMSYYQPDKASVLKSKANYTGISHISQMLRINYNYNSLYLLTLTARRDGASCFGKDRKYGFFPSFALGWNLSNEPFFEQGKISNVVNRLKLRFSWGETGNEAISAYTTLPNLRPKDYLKDDHTPAFGFYPSKLASPELGWESTRSINTGFDFGLMNDRIQGSVDLFWTNTSDLLLERTIPQVNGNTLVAENVGKTTSRGIEFQISSTNIQTKKFMWTTDFNIVHYKNKIKDVGLYDQNGNPINDIASEWFIGYPVGVNYDYVFDGIWQTGQIPDGAPLNPFPGAIRYKNLVGEQNEITPEDKTVIGSRDPKFTAGMNNSFSYGNWGLSFFLYGSYGVKMINYLQNVHTLSYRENQLDKQFWTPENPINSYPANVLDGSVNPMRMAFYEDASFLRLKDVTLNYRFNKTLLQKVNISRCEVYFNVKNLFTITNWSGLDPEFISSGTRQRSIPQVRSFIFGFRLGF